jgi:hypothetical protein
MSLTDKQRKPSPVKARAILSTTGRTRRVPGALAGFYYPIGQLTSPAKTALAQPHRPVGMSRHLSNSRIRSIGCRRSRIRSSASPFSECMSSPASPGPSTRLRTRPPCHVRRLRHRFRISSGFRLSATLHVGVCIARLRCLLASRSRSATSQLAWGTRPKVHLSKCSNVILGRSPRHTVGAARRHKAWRELLAKTGFFQKSFTQLRKLQPLTRRSCVAYLSFRSYRPSNQIKAQGAESPPVTRWPVRPQLHGRRAQRNWAAPGNWPAARFRVRAGFDSGRGDCRGQKHGPRVLPRRLLFYFCRRIPRVILLAFVLVSAAIDDKSDFKFKWLWY